MSLDPKTIKSIIDAHVGKANKEHKVWDKWRAWYRSEYWGEVDREDDRLLLENNYLYSFCDTMVASVTPPTPRVTCVPRRKDPETQQAARYREALINDVLYRSSAHETLWSMATKASVYGRSILKTVWNFSRQRPDFIALDPRYFFYDLSASRWEDIRYAIEVTTLTKAEFFARTKRRQRRRGSMEYDPGVASKAKFGSFPKWLLDSEEGVSRMSDEIKDVFEWITVYEVYDFTNDTYYHMLQGFEDPLFQGELPYVFVKNPFAMLSFNENLSDIGGLSDSQLVERLQRRLNELDTLELRHAQSSIPVTVINEALCDNPEDFADQVSHATSPGDVVRLFGKNAAPLGDILGNTPTTSLAPEFGSLREKIENTIQFVLGIPEYARGISGSSEVATELALVDAAMRTRLGRRTKLLNGIIRHMAESSVGLYEEFLESEREIPARVGGNDAVVVARKHLAARDPRRAEELKSIGDVIEEPLEIDYEVVPYSPTENSKTAQVKKITQFMELLLSTPHVDQRKLIEHILSTLDIGADVLVPAEQAAQMMQQQQMAQQQQQGGGPPPPSEDNMAAGGLAPGAEEVPPPELGGMAGGAGHPVPTPGGF
tara:strand:+ start:3177 stop:4979 length:1803 start_codon:yes stop_codon:yes gene_type:complete